MFALLHNSENQFSSHKIVTPFEPFCGLGRPKTDWKVLQSPPLFARRMGGGGAPKIYSHNSSANLELQPTRPLFQHESGKVMYRKSAFNTSSATSQTTSIKFSFLSESDYPDSDFLHSNPKKGSIPELVLGVEWGENGNPFTAVNFWPPVRWNPASTSLLLLLDSPPQVAEFLLQNGFMKSFPPLNIFRVSGAVRSFPGVLSPPGSFEAPEGEGLLEFCLEGL